MAENNDGIHVRGPSGASYTALSEEEVEYWNDRTREYVSHNHFTNVSDLQELDRLLSMELLHWRWSNWIATGFDYWGDAIDEKALHGQLTKFSAEIRLIKKSLGLDRPSRDRDKGESVVDYIENLRSRAKEFGVMREQQLTKALTLFNELRALLTLHDNTDETERYEMRCSTEDVLEWVRETAIPEYEAIDAHFRKNQQRAWIKTL